MAPRTFPVHPRFEDESERLVWEALKSQLRDDDVLMHGVRFTDVQAGEVEIDLLVLMPDSGAAVIEVKGGHVTYADGAWSQSGRRGPHSIDPIGQARNGVYALRRFLENGPSWSRGPVRAAWLLALPYVDVDGAMGPEARRDLLIGERDLDDAANMVYTRMWDHAIHAPVPADGWVESAIDALQGTHDVPVEIAGRTAARLRHVDDLTSSQAAILDVVRANPRLEVTGSAGTGKTWLAMEQARRWAEAGERVCFVAYGRGVVAYVRKAMSDLPKTSRPAFVGTFHQLGADWGAPPPTEDDSRFWDVDAPALMISAAASLPADERFTAFVVDEAQDFADSWWPALLASAASDDFRLAVFRDDEQAVFNGRSGRPELALVPLVLDENLRNAHQVVETFAPLISAQIQTRAGDGYPVEYVDCSADQVIAQADDVVESLVQDRGWLPEHVALLTTAHRHPVHVERGTDKSLYWADLWSTDDVFYSTVSGFKGLERPVIVLAVDGFHDGVPPRGVMYAGMSRARELLIVVGPSGILKPAIGDRTMRRLHRGTIPFASQAT